MPNLSTTPSLYALLIGIDCYLPNRLPDGSYYRNLTGCVRDILHVEGFLRRKLAMESANVLKLTASNSGAAEPPEPREFWPTYENIVAAFGNAILNEDQTINRTALGRLVFSSSEARQRLENITHPAIGKRAEEKLAELKRAGAPLVIYMAPLLIEAGATARVDDIWVVYLDRETQLKRVMERDGVTREEALQKVAAQMPMEEKRLYGSVVIDNCGSPAELEEQVIELWEKEMRNQDAGNS